MFFLLLPLDEQIFYMSVYLALNHLQQITSEHVCVPSVIVGAEDKVVNEVLKEFTFKWGSHKINNYINKKIL